MCSNVSYAGAQTQMIELARHLDEKKYNTRICTFDENIQLRKGFHKDCVRIDIIKRYFKYDFSWILRLSNYLSRNKIDLLYTFLPFANFFGLLASKLAQVPVVIISERNSDYKLTFFEKKIIEMNIRFSDYTIANSENGLNFLMHFIDRSLQEKIGVIYNGGPSIYLEEYGQVDKKKMPIKIPDGYTTICMVARFKPQKNHRMFFEVANIYSMSTTT